MNLPSARTAPCTAARQRSPGAPDLERLRAMLGRFSDGDITTVSDRVLVELCREWVAGVGRHSLERRLLVDTVTGELFAECRARQGAASLGPCPRALHVGLGAVEPGPAPRRLHVHQYEVSSGLDAQAYSGILQHAERDVAALRERYQREIKGYPGLAEPFVVFAPTRVVRDGGLALQDASGGLLTLSRHNDEGRSAALERVAAEADPEWVVGSLHELPDGLVLDPCGVALREASITRYLRLR